jgi:hypothetical protein
MTKYRIATAVALLFTLSMVITLVAVPLVNAHDPPWQIPTYSFCSVSPNPIGVGQQVNVNFWVTIPPPTAQAQFGDRWGNMTVKVTKPDGTTQTLGPFTSDAVGGSHTTYTPAVVGNYTFQMFFGGQTLTGSNLAPGDDPSNYVNVGDYYKPCSSNVFSLTVQEELIGYPSAVPLPTEYWTRPIYAENNNWYSIAGNWLGIGQSSFACTGWYNANGNYNPYTTAPNTAHIMWTKPVAFGGTMGGEYGGSETSNFYSTSQYEPKFAPIIMNGILYYTMFPGSSTNPAGWAAVDLHTGQTLWTKNTTDFLRCGQILDYHTPNQYGGLAYLWSVPIGTSVFGPPPTYLKMWDAMTGNYILTITNITIPLTALTTDTHGGLIGYCVNSDDNTLNMWNSTRCINLAYGGIYGGGTPLADTWTWRPPQDAVIDFSLGLQWSAPLAADISGSPLIDYANGLYGLTLYGVADDVALFYESNVWSGFQEGWQIEAGYSAIDGRQLWIANRTQTPYALIYGDTGMSDYGNWMGDGAYVDLDMTLLSITGYNLKTGQKLWGPTALPNASPFSSYGAEAQIANGTFYLWLYGGDLYSYNILTGALNWQYHTPSGGYESPYGRWPLWTFSVGTIADGKIFVPEGHMYSPPLFHGAQQLALNLTNGDVVWSIDAFDVTSAPAISDGVMVTLNAYDNQIYAYGKGPSATTVSAPNVGISSGSSVIISGTVTDISAGTEQNEQAARFPSGVPVVSDESMSAWMEYVYMKQAKPANATGVPVTIDVIDGNGNYRSIGTATSDASGTFSYMWKPDIPGKYTLIATFAGSESYYASYSETAFGVTEAPPATPTPTPSPASMTDLYFVPAAAGIIIAIAIATALIMLMLRRRP